ncbi:MAG: glycosyltransferase family 4 protein [Bacteriovorax sp.]|nr:glycosyltransferase family 4 protein [Bacteriovorax sp.]
MNLLIIRSAELSTWGSCKVISPNLQATYKLLSDRFTLTWFDIPVKYVQQEIDSSSSHIIDLSLKIKNEKPDQIIFIDHLPNPAEILNNLSLVMELDQLPPLVFHIYGDFTYFSKDWLELTPKLINHPVKFVTASSSQKNLLSYFCEDSRVIEQFCFPVNSEEYYFDSEARIKLRKEMQISDQDIVILYSGRISLQKNVDVLLKEYLKLIKNSTQCIHLWIVGAFDDLGAPFMGVETNEGYLYSKFESILAGHPKDFINKIKFWGIQNKEKLREIKSAADQFISLSLYHDEDYGMSPAEALACGLPTLLTDWGGYSSFASKNWRCQLMPVSITEFGLQIKTSAIKEFLNTYLECYINDTDRKRWSNEFLSQFSIKENGLKLESILSTSFRVFKGFNWALAPFSQQYGKSSEHKTLNANTGPSDKNFYFQVYKNYISQDDAPDKESTYDTIQWMYDYIKNSEVELVTEARKSNRSYHHYLKPFSKNYYGPTNPALLFDGKITTKLIDKKIWTLRDGLVPVCLFFKEHLPNKFAGEIAIHKSLWFLVPDHWREKVLFYEIKNEVQFSKSQLPQKIFITGMLNSTLADPEEFDQDLVSLKEILGKENIEKMEILAFLPNKKANLWGSWEEENLLKFSHSLFRNIKNEVQFSEWQNIQSETNFSNSLYYEINRGYFIKDTFTKHFALSRGAGLLKSSVVEVPCELIKTHKLSLYHSINIYRPNFTKIPAYINPFDHEYFEYFKKLFESNTKNPKASTSWDSWFASYLKKYYKLYPPTIL